MSPKIAVISIGNELLTGKTVNTNLFYLGKELAKLGLKVRFAPVVRDEKEAVHEALSSSLLSNDILITTGGLGPTCDDITKELIAEFFGLPLIIDEDVWQKIQKRFPGRHIPVMNRRQAELPAGFTTLANPVGSAPGLYYENNGKMIIVLPGVPREMEHIFSESVVPLLIEKFHLPSLRVRTAHTIDIPESSLAELIADIHISDGIELAFLPQAGMVDLRIIGSDEREVDGNFDFLVQRISTYLWGIDDETLPEKIHTLLTQQGLTLAVAESCTGGMIQQKLTAIAGSSTFFEGGLVTYSNAAKINILGVEPEIIEKFGAVSTQTAEQMAIMVRKKFKTDIGISLTGIAGPSGGSEDKPVGTVCFGIATPKIKETYQKFFTGNRDIIRTKSAHYLLYLLLKALLDEVKTSA